MTKAPVVCEHGFMLDNQQNAGPAFLDYSILYAYDGIADIVDVSAYLGQREYAWVLCDGRLMGQNESDTFPIGSDDPIQFVEWQDCEYVVMQDIEWEIIIARPEPRDTPTYEATLQDADNADAGDDKWWAIPSMSTNLEEHLDAQVVGAVEAEGGDVWMRRSDHLLAPYAVTLMRCPLDRSRDEAVIDMEGMEGTADPRYPLDMAPIGLLVREHWEEISDVLLSGTAQPVTNIPGATTHWPETWLEGTNDGPSASPLHALRKQQYRPWEPYDDLTDTILLREAHTVEFAVPNNDNVQDVMFVDDDVTDGFEPSGNEAFPRMSNGKKLYRLKGRFPGPVIISRNDPRPFVLHVAGLPVRLSRYFNGDADYVTHFYRPTVIPIRWNITCNIKVK